MSPTAYPSPVETSVPTADFNKQVYHFDENQQIFQQHEYEKRVMSEAELLVALEALKSSILLLHKDMDEVQGLIEA